MGASEEDVMIPLSHKLATFSFHSPSGSLDLGPSGHEGMDGVTPDPANALCIINRSALNDSSMV